MEKQVAFEFYNFNNYVNRKRWMSYYHQVNEVIKSNSKTCLVIGKGDGIVPAILQHCGLDVDTFDYEDQMKPTYLGDIRKIHEIVDREYDCIVCCQVLEHIEYEYFESVIESLRRICKKRLILSLPEIMLLLSIDIYVPGIKDKGAYITIPRFWKKRTRRGGQHMWEVGLKGKGKKKIKRIISKHFRIIRDYNAGGNLYNWFIIADSI